MAKTLSLSNMDLLPEADIPEEVNPTFAAQGELFFEV